MPQIKEIPKTMQRRATLTARKTDAGTEYDVSLSSETPVERMFGRELLVHTPKAINMERAQDGLAFLINHDPDRVAGRIQDFRLERGKTRGRLVWDEGNDDAREWKRKVDAQIVRDTSITYSIDEVEIVENREGLDDVRITRWTPVEGSIVSIGADANVGVGRSLNTSKEQSKMPENNNGADKDKGGELNVLEFTREQQQYHDSGIKDGATLERARQTEINEIFDDLRAEYKTEPFEELRKRCLQLDTSADQARKAVFKLINADPIESIAPGAGEDTQMRSIHPGETSLEKWVRGVTETLECRTGIETDDKIKARQWENEFSGMRLVELGRSYLQATGLASAGAMQPYNVARECLVRAAQLPPTMLQRSGGIISHSSSDFANVLANIAWKMLGKGYEQAPETWRPLVEIVNMPDYKEGKIPSLTSFTDLLPIAENGEYKRGTMGDVGEPIKMQKFGRLFNISREALLGDDLNAFTRIPRAMGGAAARKVGDLVWNDIIIDNPLLSQDGVALFASGHNNLAGTPALPSVAALDLAFTAMAVQTDPDDRATLNATPAYMMVPHALRGTALVLTSAQGVQSQAPGATSGVVINLADNRFAALNVIAEARLDADSSTGWYLSVDPRTGVVDTIAVAFLNGQESPFMEQQEGFYQDGIEYKIRLEASSAALAYQGLFKNAGA